VWGWPYPFRSATLASIRTGDYSSATMALLSDERTRYRRTSHSPLGVRESPPPAPRPPKLLDRVREANRLRHGSRSTEKSYVAWIRRYIEVMQTAVDRSAES
jgi:hypothetical protein